MADCKHELKDLVGMADGIHCKACGAVFRKMEDVQPAAEKPAKKKEKKNAGK